CTAVRVAFPVVRVSCTTVRAAFPVVRAACPTVRVAFPMGQEDFLARVFAALRAAAERSSGPLVRAALRADAERSEAVRFAAADFACLERAFGDAAECPSFFSAALVAFERVRETLFFPPF